MDERIERLKRVAEGGDIDNLYMLIQEDAYLLEHIDQVPFFDTPLHIAASIGHIPFVLEMMRLKPSFARKSNPDGFSPIHLAIRNGQAQMVRQLLQVDGNLVRAEGREGMTPLHYAAAYDYLDLLAEFLSVCPHSIEDVTIRNMTALHIALKYNKLESFKLLVGWLGQNRSENSIFWERKVLNWKDEEGNTVLHVAVSKNQPQAVSHVLAWTNVDINIKNLEGKTAWDILQQQTQVNNSEIRAMLCRAGALSASSLPMVTSYPDYLRPKVSVHEKFRICRSRGRSRISDDKRNALLVVVTLLITVTYQGVLSPPGGFWQDDNRPRNDQESIALNVECNTTKSNDRIGGIHLPPHEAGTAVGFISIPFWVFMILNSATFMVSYTIIFLIIPSGYIYVMFQAALVFLYICYFASLSVIGVSLWAAILLVTVSTLLYILVVVKAFPTWTRWWHNKACL